MRISLDAIEAAAISAIHQERTVAIGADTLLEMVNTIRRYECQAANAKPVAYRFPLSFQDTGFTGKYEFRLAESEMPTGGEPLYTHPHQPK